MISPYLLENKYLAVKRCRHGLFLFNRNDAMVGISLDEYGEWCEAEITLLQFLVNPGDVIIDVGAYIGTHTVPLANRVGSHGVVLALEPRRQSYYTLCANVALNGLQNVLCMNMGASNEAGHLNVTPLPSPLHRMNFSAFPLTGDNVGPVVEVATLDSLEMASCRLMKVDVEGMEAEVLLGAVALIEQHKPILFVERCNAEADRQRLFQTLLQLDYRAYIHDTPYFSPSNFYNNRVNVWTPALVQRNLLCYHETEISSLNLEQWSGD